jgi:hypothetical protein
MERLLTLGRRWEQALPAGMLAILGGNEVLRRALLGGLRVTVLTVVHVAAGEAIFGLLCFCALTRIWLLNATTWLHSPHNRAALVV